MASATEGETAVTPIEQAHYDLLLIWREFTLPSSSSCVYDLRCGESRGLGIAIEHLYKVAGVAEPAPAVTSDKETKTKS